MQNFLIFIIRRLLAAVISFIVITMILYAGVMLTPPEARASLYLPPGRGAERTTQARMDVIIREHHLDDPYLIQYAEWLKSLLTGSWGYSPTLHQDVLPALIYRTPVTLELAFFSLILMIPLGLFMGLIAGWKEHKPFDLIFRFFAFIGTSTPTFIFALMLISILYIKLGWLSPGRMDVNTSFAIKQSDFIQYTGALTLDGLLNQRWDIFLSALKHMVMPAITLSLFYWATLGRVARSLVIEQKDRDYVTAARARGIKDGRILWSHVQPNILAPSLTTLAFSAASIVTSIFVIEVIFALPGISQVIVIAMSTSPDSPAILGFTIYSIISVIGLMLILDLVQALVDPRVRSEVMSS